MELHNDHNVYILGAGFSAEAGLPLVKDFLVRMRDSHEWLETQKRSTEAKAIADVISFRLEAAAAAYWVSLDLENVEQLFSLASAIPGGMEDSIRLGIAATLDFTFSQFQDRGHQFRISGDSNVFNGKDKRWPAWITNVTVNTASSDDCGTYKLPQYAFHVAWLLGMFKTGEPHGKNTFLTFNYDTLLEKALVDLHVPFSYGFKAGEVSRDASCPKEVGDADLKVLKLHGSANWARAGHGRGDKPEFTLFGDYSAVQKRSLVPELLPPTWKKVFQAPLASVWEQAVIALRTATRVVLIGFSMPPTDTHFRYLLAAGLHRNVSLRQILFVNPDEEGQKNAANQILRNSYIESRLIVFEKKSLREFTFSWSCMDRIGRNGENRVSFNYF